MYEELIKSLRICAVAERYYECAGCAYRDKVFDCNSVMKIDAADAIEELQTAVSGYEATTDVEFVKEEGHERIRFVPKWISVNERLPDTMKDKSAYSGWSAEIAPSDDVLCYLGSEGRQTVAWYSHTYEEWTTVDENTVYKNGDVTHWMPLPTPPKEETE